VISTICLLLIHGLMSTILLQIALAKKRLAQESADEILFAHAGVGQTVHSHELAELRDGKGFQVGGGGRG